MKSRNAEAGAGVRWARGVEQSRLQDLGRCVGFGPFCNLKDMERDVDADMQGPEGADWEK